MPIRNSSLRFRLGATAFLLTLAGGFIAPFTPVGRAEPAPDPSPGPAPATSSPASASSAIGVVDLSPTPPSDTQAVAPNVALTFDDSGSMSFGYMPDDADYCSWKYASSAYNKIYYNPQISYTPPLKADDSALPNVSFSAAPLDGYHEYLGFGGDTVNLSQSYTPTEEWDRYDVNKHYNNTISKSCVPSAVRGHAYYAESDGTLVDLTKIKQGATVNGKTRTVAEEQQNFANWYSYYRTRNLMTKTAISQAFAGLQAPIRMVWQTIWPHASNRPWSKALSTSDAISPFQDIKDASGAVVTTGNRPDFFDWLFELESANGTPDREAAQRAGDYFMLSSGSSRKGTTSDPYWNGLSGTDSKELACRQNYHVMVTDGYWNESDSEVATPDKTSDDMSSTPDGKAEKIDESSIYWNMADTKAKSFANIAYNYWATDLAPGIDNDVAPYLADTSHNIWSQAYDPDLPWNNKEIYFNPKNDPATWQHLVQFVVTLGISGERVYPDDYDALRKGDKNWPKPVADSGSALDDMWHAAVNSRGSYASASNPAALVDSLQRILGGISDRSSKPTISAVNASVLTLGALSFNTGYSTTDWSGVLQAVTLNQDGTTAGVQWDAGTQLDDRTTARSIYTDTMDSVTGKVTGLAFTSTNADSLDATEAAELMVPASSGDDDTSGNRIDYLAGSRKQEDAGVMRKRNHLLGAIINSQPVYVSYPSGGYSDNYPTGSPEAAEDAQTYDEFIQAHADRPGTLYVGANDGMLHAFDASLKCNDTDDDGNCISYGPDPAASAGKELWAFVPRAVYPNLGNLTSVSGFKFAPTVDGTPVIRDVFFGSSSASNTDNKWHTLLVGGLRFGGRGVYALDVTDPTSMAASKVLWEFDHDSPVSAGCVTNDDTACNPDDLGYTYGQPNIGRLANGRWVVIVPTSYYPDCSKGDSPSNCQTLAAASNEYSALFILDAQTGEQIAELKTPTDITGVRSFGLGPPVLGDYENDHIDDVAYAGDLAGNLWRFDLSSSTASDWTVTLAYQPETQGAQPITVMPRLFPDPTTNRFMVVFGTGKYLGADDNKTDDMATQSVYGIRDKLDDKTPVTVTHDDLQEQTMSEVAGSGDLAGVTLRKLSDNDVAADKGGWYIDLVTKDSDGKVTDAGERVVVTPAALFDTNTAIIQTLIPSATDPCDPMLLGSVMLIDANSGGPGSGVSAVGGYPYVGARVNNVRTSGTIPVTTTVGGGKALLPGLTLTGSKKNPDAPFSGDAPIWRRRSWSIINNVH